MIRMTVVVLVFAVVGFLLFRQGELTYMDETGDWRWHNWSERIQIRTLPTMGDDERRDHSDSSLRKVNRDEGYIVFTALLDTGRHLMIRFTAQCQPGTEIETDSGPLRCSEEGDQLVAYDRWPEDCGSYYRNYGGFIVNENLCGWDFTQLERERSLNRAEPLDEVLNDGD